MRVVCLGAHILDVLGRPVTGIPEGQGRSVLEEIRLTAAGTAGGTAVDLAKLGAEVQSVGAIGDDAAGRMLRMLLDQHGVGTGGLAVKPGAATPATILPIRPDGSRPALHAPGAMGLLSAGDVDADVLAEADAVHVGGPDVLGAFASGPLPELLAHAAAHSTVISVDLLTVGRPAALAALERLWPLADYVLPNDDQLRGMTGLADLPRAAQVLRDAGAKTVVVTRGADGALIVAEGVEEEVPALDVDVVDTTGCGDAFSAGFLVGRDGGSTLREAARLGAAAAALVAGGLGSDAGITGLPQVLDVRNSGPSRDRLNRTAEPSTRKAP